MTKTTENEARAMMEALGFDAGHERLDRDREIALMIARHLPDKLRC